MVKEKGNQIAADNNQHLIFSDRRSRQKKVVHAKLWGFTLVSRGFHAVSRDGFSHTGHGDSLVHLPEFSGPDRLDCFICFYYMLHY